MGVLENGLGETAGERLAKVPYCLGPLRSRRRGLLEVCFQPIEPLVKAGMELPAQGVPLFACTDLLERDNLSSSHG